jgi:hypothetical protein
VSRLGYDEQSSCATGTFWSALFGKLVSQYQEGCGLAPGFHVRPNCTRAKLRRCVGVCETRRAAHDLEEANSPTKLNWRETGWMDGWGYLGSQPQRMHQRIICSRSAAQCFFLLPHAHHRLPALSMLPPRVLSTEGMAASSSRTDYPSSPRRAVAEVLSLSRTRIPHAVSFTAFVFIDKVGGPGHAFRSFFKTRCLFFVSR